MPLDFWCLRQVPITSSYQKMALYQMWLYQYGSCDEHLQGVCSILYGYCYQFFIALSFMRIDQAKDSTEPAELTRAEDDHRLITLPLNNQSEPAVSTRT